MAEDSAITKEPADEVSTAEHTRSGAYYRPAVDIMEKADELLVLADIPGAAAEAIDVDFEDGMLKIHAKVPPRQEEGTEYLIREYGVGDFYRQFQVSESVDAEKISAEYADGVLTLHLPKAEAAKPRRIEVTTL